MCFYKQSVNWEETGMTMNKIIEKLRRRNRGQYTLLGICIFLSVFLVTAFTCMYFSKTVQNLLPEGGDTRKLVWLLLFAAVAGCTIFTVYGANLFFRNKSREFGVFLALGERKKRLAAQMVRELATVIAKYVFWGIAAAIPASWLIWKIFETLLTNAGDLTYRFSMTGAAAGFLFACFLVLCIGAAGKRFVKRANIMDILNEQRKTEVVKEIKPWTGKLGIGMIVTGLLLAMAAPQIWVRMTLSQLPALWNATWLICVAGLYLFLLSAVGSSRKGRNAGKYYGNIISANLMRFTARQTTRNMCVIALLIFTVMISVFWAVSNYYASSAGGDNAPFDYSLHYPAPENQVTENDIHNLAQKHGVEITGYEETQAAELIIRYAGRDLDDNGKYFDIIEEKLASFLPVSAYNKISGKKTPLRQGEYKTITYTDYQETIWEGPDGLREVENPVTGATMRLAFAGTEEFDNLADMSRPFFFIVSDEDYRRLSESLDQAWMENMVFFNVKNVFDTYAFATELKNEFILHASSLSDHIGGYDAHKEALTLASGEDYGYTEPAGLSPDNVRLMGDWKYAPFFKVLMKADVMQMVAIFVLLCVYIAIISLSAIGVMSYVRSVTIAIENKKLFEDLEKLGANHDYRERVFRQQLKKIYAYPVAAGCLVSLLFTLLLTWFNDMRLQPYEVMLLEMEAGIALGIAAFMYLMYRLGLKKGKEIIKL